MSAKEWGGKFPTRSQADDPSGYGPLITGDVAEMLRCPSAAPAAEGSTAEVPDIDLLQVETFLASKPKYTGGGVDGWTYAQLRFLCNHKYAMSAKVDGHDVLSGITAIVNDLAKGKLASLEEGAPRRLRDRLVHTRGVALRKAQDSDDPRPLGIGEVFVALAAGIILRTDEMRVLIPDNVGPTEVGNGVRGGVESLPAAVSAYLRLHPDHLVIKFDIRNAFNSLHRANVLACAHTYPPLAHLITLMYGAPNQATYDGFTLTVERGVNQGDPMGPVLYSTASKPAVDSVLRQHPTVRITGIMDDKYLMGPSKDVLMAMETYNLELSKLCLQQQVSKTAALHGFFLTPSKATPGSRFEAHILCNLHNITFADGLSVGGVPVGSTEYVHKELSALVDTLTQHMGRVREAIKHHTTVQADAGAPAVRAARIYKLLRWCLAPAMLTYWLRTLPVEVIRPHAWRYDEEVFAAVLDLLEVPHDHAHVNASTDSGRLVRDRVHLHAESGGLGLTAAAQVAPDARLGNLLLTAHLVARALGPGFDPKEHGDAALPELSELLEAPETQRLGLEGLQGVTTLSAFEVPRFHMSSNLAHARRDARLQAVLRQVLEPEAAAWLLSCGGEGANYLMADRGALHRGVPELANDHFRALLRARAGLQPAPYGHSPRGFVSAAEPPGRWGDTCFKMGCGQPLGTSGLHNLVCQEIGQGGVRGMRTSRHAPVKYALAAAMRGVGGAASVPMAEPNLLTYWEEKPSYLAAHAPRTPAHAPRTPAPGPAPATTTAAAPTPTPAAATPAPQATNATMPAPAAVPAATPPAASSAMQEEEGAEEEAPPATLQPPPDHAVPPPPAPPGPEMDELPSETTAGGRRDWVNAPRGDWVWKRPGAPVIYDLVITHPLPRRSPPAARAAGHAAHEAHSDKINKYNRRFEIPRGQFEPIAVETGGRLHPASRRALGDFVKAAVGVDPGEAIPAELAATYQRAMRTVLDSLSVSLAREVAVALLHGGAERSARVPVVQARGAGPPTRFPQR